MKIDNKYLLPIFKSKISITTLLLSSLLVACVEDNSGDASLPETDNPGLALGIPASLTGGSASSVPLARLANSNMSAASQTIKLAKAGTGQPCAYLGNEDKDDPFRNGYETSKFMISTMASWTCIADLLIDVAGFVAHNGLIIETENDNNSANFEADEATHYSVTDDSATQVTVRLYYNYSRSQPPVVGEQAQFYTSWNKSDNGDIEGRMIIDGAGVDWENQDNDAPAMMRMDFNFTGSKKTADMFLQFDDNNLWADGFRIQIIKQLGVNPLLKVFEARGLISMKSQFAPVANISEIPDIHLFTVSDALGNGASIAELQNVSLPFVLNAEMNNHLGDYLFTKQDIYFFEHDMDWEYINKAISSSEYRGNRTTPATGGSWIFPFNPSLDLIITELNLDNDYFTGSKCANIGDDCSQLSNAVHDVIGGFAGKEQNQGTDPLDWRSAELANADYLTTVFPNGINWTGAFEHNFTPDVTP